MAHTRTWRLFKHKLHHHSYMYMDKTTQGRNASSWWSLPRCAARCSWLSVYALILSDPNPRQHLFPATLTSLVPRQALPTRMYVRMQVRTHTHKCSRHRDPLGLAHARPNKHPEREAHVCVATQWRVNWKFDTSSRGPCSTRSETAQVIPCIVPYNLV